MKKQIKSTAQNSFTDTALLKEIRELIISARKAVVRNIDTIQVITNLEIGRRIFLFEQNERKQMTVTRAGTGMVRNQRASRQGRQAFLDTCSRTFALRPRFSLTCFWWKSLPGETG